MAQLSPSRYLQLTQSQTYGRSDGLYYDTVAGALVVVINDDVVQTIGTSGVNVEAGVNLDATGTVTYADRAKVTSPADGKVKVTNAAATAGAVLDCATADTVKVRNAADNAAGALDAGAVTASSVAAAAAGTVGFTGRSQMSSPSDGTVYFKNAAGNAFANVQAANINGVNSTLTGVAALQETSAPGAAANYAQIYAIDNAGKTQLVCLFGSGAAQVIATEP